MGTEHLRTTIHLIVISYDGGKRWVDAKDADFTPKYGVVRHPNINSSPKRMYYFHAYL